MSWMTIGSLTMSSAVKRGFSAAAESWKISWTWLRYGQERAAAQSRDVGPVDANLAGVERLEAGDAARERGLAAAGTAGQAKRRAALDREVDAVERCDRGLGSANQPAPLIGLR